ncbi:hypothetical protein [Halosimplex marinum]
MAYTGTDKDGGIGYVTKSEDVRLRDLAVRYLKRVLTLPVRILKR